MVEELRVARQVGWKRGQRDERERPSDVQIGRGQILEQRARHEGEAVVVAVVDCGEVERLIEILLGFRISEEDAESGEVDRTPDGEGHQGDEE